MRYIENFELREWVKDNLRKTIFQKAHALAIQTGCEILVKLHDATDTTSHRYYAAGSLHKAYNNHTLRKHPAEKFVSGETGSPLMDQAIQSDDIEHRLLSSDSDNVQQESENNQQFFDENNTDPLQDGYDTTHSEPHYTDNQPLFSNTKDSVQERLPPSQVDSHTSPEEPTLSLHLSVSNEPPDDDADTGESSIEQGISTEETGATVTDELPEGVQIKVEKMEPDESSYHEHETSMSSETTQHSQPESFDDLQGGMSMDTGMMPTHGEPHTGESDRFTLPISPKPYQCAVCQKAFRSVQVLQKHTQTFHQVRGPSAMMSSHSRGKGHMMVRQNTSKRLQCVMCNRAFPHADLLQDHMARSHMSRDTHQSSQLAASQQQLPPPVFTNTNIAPSTVTSAFGMDNSPGPFNLMESANSSQSQTSTSVPLMQPGSSFPMSTPSLTHQPKRKPGGATYRFPAIGRPSLSTQGKPQSSSPKILHDTASNRSTPTIELNEEGVPVDPSQVVQHESMLAGILIGEHAQDVASPRQQGSRKKTSTRPAPWAFTDTPRFIDGPDPDTYLLGGIDSLVRKRSDYIRILLEVCKGRKLTISETDKARIMCIRLFRQEFTKEELATGTLTGISHDPYSRIQHNEPVLDKTRVQGIFSQARLQYPAMVDCWTDPTCKTFLGLNSICQQTRVEMRKEQEFKSFVNEITHN